FSVERQLPWNLTVKAEYVSKLMHNIWTDLLVDINQFDLKYLSLGSLLAQDVYSPAAKAAGIPIPYPGFVGNVAQALRPYPQYDRIPQGNAMASNASHNALELTVQKRTSNGLNFSLGYTLSKRFQNDGRTGLGSAATFLQHNDQRGCCAKHLHEFT